MAIDKVLSSSIANGAVTAALISNTANLVVSSLTANVITITTISGSANVTGDMTVGGNLTISGTTTYVNTTDLNIGDAIISLNADLAANVSPTEDAGISINRGASTNAQFKWIESTDNWSIGNTTVSGVLTSNDHVITGTANVSTGINVGANVNLGTTYIDVGNSTVNTTITDITVSTNTVNVASIINVGANVNLSTSHINVGNSTVNTSITSTTLTTTSNTVSIGTAAYFVANGNVGIGTSSPAVKLDVANAIGRAARIGGFQFSGTTSSADGGNNLLGSGVYWNGSNLTATEAAGAVIQLGNGAINFQALTGLTPSSTYSYSPQLSLDSSGNLGLGVTPSVWYSNRTALNIGNAVSAISGNSQLELRSNAYLNTSAVETYINSYFANKYIMSGGTHAWFNAPSGTAGANVSFTQAMTLDANGRLGIGPTSPTTVLHTSSSTAGIFAQGTSTKTNNLLFTCSNSYNYGVVGVVSGDNTSGGDIYALGYVTSAGGSFNPVASWTSSGNVGIGTSSPSVKFQTVQTIADWTGDFKNYTAGAYGLRVDLSGSSGAQAALQVYTATGNGIIVKNDGLVGIGTFSPSAEGKLTIGTTTISDKNGIIFNRGAASTPSATQGGIFYELNGISTYETFTFRTNGGYKFQNANGATTFAAIDSSGNLGIGVSPTSTKLHVYGDWVSGHSTVKVQTVTTFASGGTTGVGLYDSDGTRSSYYYHGSTGSYIGPAANKQFALVTNDTIRLTISAGGDVYTSSRNLFSSMGQAFSVAAGGTLGFNIEALGGLFTAGLLYVLGRENSLNQTIAVYSFTLSYSYASGNRYIRLQQIHRSTVNNDYGNVYAYLSTYAASWTSTDQVYSGTSSAVSDIYFRNAVGAGCQANYLVRFTGS